MKIKLAHLLVVAFTFVVLSGALFSVNAQPAGWRLVNEKIEDDGYKRTNFWEHPSERKRTQEVFYFKNYTPLTKQSEREITRDKDGKKLYSYSSTWTTEGRQISYQEASYDKNENVNTSKQWRYEEENGKILEPRINEEFNPITKKWVRILRSVRVLFIPLRIDDAKRAEKLLKERGFEVNLREREASGAIDHLGKLYYQGNGIREDADFIARVVKNIENVEVTNGTVSNDENSSDYSLWISSKKEETSPTKSAPTQLGNQETELFNNSNPDGTLNEPRSRTMFTLAHPARITTLLTYHWNSGEGAQPGTIGLRDQNGKIYGLFAATGSSGAGGTPNVNWTAKINISVPAGTYTVLDSDTETWSNNAQSGFAGFAIVRGYLLDKSLTIAPPDNNPGKVVIYFGADKQRAAETAAKILRENGLTVELIGGAKFNKAQFRKMYFASSGTKDKAVKIANLLKTVEPLTPVAGNPPQGFDWNYLVFLQDLSEISLDWNTNAHWANVRPPEIKTFYCPANPAKEEIGGVSGTDIYYYASAICPAAVHAGKITFQTGGLVTVQTIKGEDFPNVVGSERNGVKSESVNGVFWSYKFID